MRAASTSRVSKPGSTLLSRMKLRTNRPAPTSSTRASVTSPTTSVLCNRRRPPVAPGASSRSASSIPGAEARQAGRRPNATPVTTARPRLKPRTRPSSAISVVRGSACGPTRGSGGGGGEGGGGGPGPPAAGGGGGPAGAAGAGLPRLDSLPPATRARVAGAEARREQLDVADHTLQGDAGPQPRHGVEEVHAAVRFGLRIL